MDATDWQFEAFRGLHQYLSWHVAPDRRGVGDARIIAEVGEWIGTQVLGPIADALATLARRRHVTVRVIVPAQAAELLVCPLELAHVNGKPLSIQDITLVLQSGQEAGADDAPGTRDRLRVLGLFSLPEGGQPLNLRRERQALVKLVDGLAESGKAVDVRVLQYGVTRDLLREILAEAEGWDIIHISGHGAPGELVLETADGRPDPVTATQLADMLAPAREHVRLVTVAACWSAAESVADQRRHLGLPIKSEGTQTPDTERAHHLAAASAPSSTLATELAGRLDCAVLAMRYPVGDEFAIALTGRLYDLLLASGQPLPGAVAMTLRELFALPPEGSASPGRAFPPLSVATPALFGGTAVGLSLAAPERDGPAEDDISQLKLTRFPAQPERFVGRVAVMARSSAALALRSGVPGVLLHGMPGGGKTACALELAYGHEHAFDHLVWYKAPDQGMDITGALTDFAFVLEQELPGFHMLDALVTEAKLIAFAPKLTELAKQRRMLIVIDNAESLLTESGQWRDPRWGQVTGALTAHQGWGRVILTSRRIPSGLTGLRVQAVDTLSADEALLLAQELPHLEALGQGKISGIRPHVARRLARRVLEVAQGHPKLLELANDQAAHPERLAALVEAGHQAWRAQGGLPDGFFSSTKTAASAEGYWPVLAAWTRSVADNLAPGQRDLFWFLCCLEEGDRERATLDDNWNDLWNQLGRSGEPPDPSQALAAVASQGLVSIRRKTGHVDESYTIHPGIAEAGRNHAGQAFQAAVDAEAAAFWAAVQMRASGRRGNGTVDTRLHVRAGLAVVPYLIRQHRWDAAGTLLEDAFVPNQSRANAAAVLPAIGQIARHEPRWAVLRARVLAVLAPAAADASLRAAMTDADARGDYRMAATAAAELYAMSRDGGRLAEALDLARQKAGYTRQAGLGPWTQLSDEVSRLEVLTFMGHARQVLDEISLLRDRIATLPATVSDDDPTHPWGVREALLNTGYHAAALLGQFADALTLNADKAASMRDRRAPATEIARTRIADYGPLLHLGRTEEALQVLLDCRQVFQDARDTQMLGNTLGALAHTESARGHGDAAIRLQRDALRYLYEAGDVNSIAASYHNLGTYLHYHAREPAPSLASHLTAALIRTLTGDGASAPDSARQAAADLCEFGTSAVPPVGVADLDRQVGDIPGTDLPGLLTALSPDLESAEAALRDLIAQVRDIAAQPPVPP